MSKETRKPVYEVRIEGHPPILPGMKVRIQIDKKRISLDWTPEALTNRQDRVIGFITGHHDSHGLCFDVIHEDGTRGCYDLHELIVLEIPNISKAPKNCVIDDKGSLTVGRWSQKNYGHGNYHWRFDADDLIEE